MPKTVVSVIHEGETIEIQWGDQEPAEGRIKGYVQIVDGALYVPFRDGFDRPRMFVLSPDRVGVFVSEDVPPAEDAKVAWRSQL